MMSQMSHMKSITQVNHTIESHEMGHMWDNILHKIDTIPTKNGRELVEI